MERRPIELTIKATISDAVSPVDATRLQARLVRLLEGYHPHAISGVIPNERDMGVHFYFTVEVRQEEL